MPVLWSYTYRSSFKSPSLIPSSFPAKCAEEQGQNSRKHEADEQDARPHHRISTSLHGGVDADRSDETAGSHAGTGWNIFQMEDHRGERTGDHRGECRWNPDFRVPDDISHLEHRGSESLCQKTTPFIFTEA